MDHRVRVDTPLFKRVNGELVYISPKMFAQCLCPCGEIMHLCGFITDPIPWLMNIILSTVPAEHLAAVKENSRGPILYCDNCKG